MDNSDIDTSRLYTRPEEIAHVYHELMSVSDHFVIAASFGNVHGVYKPGNVQLRPEILNNAQQLVEERYETALNPVSFVFHGGSGSEPRKITEAIGYGVVKMNIDTDIQWAFWDGVNQYSKINRPYLKRSLAIRRETDYPIKNTTIRSHGCDKVKFRLLNV